MTTNTNNPLDPNDPSYIDGHYTRFEDYAADVDDLYQVCGRCGYADATANGCDFCGVSA